MIIHALPTNTSPCGGIKVHYDLCEIEREAGLVSVIAFPDKNKIPTWFKRDVGEILSYEEAKALAIKEKERGKDVAVIGWEDTDVLEENFPIRDFIQITYIQGHVFWKGHFQYLNKYVWFVSNFVKNYIDFRGFIIEPYIRPTVFYPPKKKKFSLNKQLTILVQGRKDGNVAVEKLKNLDLYKGTFKNKVNFVICDDLSESDFADKMRNADIFFSHSFPEGFGLPALEAFACKTLVIGFTGGGGAEFMDNGINCFYASDGDYEEIYKILWKIFSMDEKDLNTIINNAYERSLLYSKEMTSVKLKAHLRAIGANL